MDDIHPPIVYYKAMEDQGPLRFTFTWHSELGTGWNTNITVIKKVSKIV